MAKRYPIRLYHPDLAGVTITAATASSHRIHAKSGWVDDVPDVDLHGMTRDELDTFAREAGVERPDLLDTKQAVVDAINDLP